jgi:hypothetical protein
MLPGPKLAGQSRVSVEEITGEVTFGNISLDEIDDIIVHEKLVERVRIFHAMDGGDVRRWITGIGSIFQEGSEYSEPFCSGHFCPVLTSGTELYGGIIGTHRFNNCSD